MGRNVDDETMTEHGHSIFPLFDSWVGFALLGTYAVIALGLTQMFASGYANNKESFLLAKRELGTFDGAMSISAAWLWAPGLFISAQQAYVNGLVGLFWFCLGNFITLMFFAGFAKKLRDKHPQGFTFSNYIKSTYTGNTYWFYRVEMILLAICAFAINLIAGSTTVALLTGIDYTMATILMSAVALLYAFRNGLKATVVTEIIKIVTVWTGVLLLVPLVVNSAGGLDVVKAGMAGIKGSGGSIVGTSFAWGVFTSFGIAAFLGHMAGPWRDNSFYQRAFAIKPNAIIPAFVLASFIFIMIPIGMGIIGFVAAGSGLDIPNNLLGNTNIIAIANFLPAPFAALFCFMVFAGLIAILDSQMASITNLIGNDLAHPTNAVKYARIAMVVLALLGVTVANIPGVTIGNLFLFFSIMGATLFIPSMLAIVNPGVFFGPDLFKSLVAGFIAAMGLYFIVGSTFYATLVAVFVTPLVAYVLSNRK
jgi:Na+/proline symporter